MRKTSLSRQRIDTTLGLQKLDLECLLASVIECSLNTHTHTHTHTHTLVFEDKITVNI
jgi:hypothetical protein